MSKYIDADRLRAEIENLIERYSSVKAKGVLQEGYKGGRLIGYEDVLNILKRIQEESEKPIDGLEDELKDYLRRYYNCDYPKQIEENTCSPTMPHIVEAARHFAEWGAEHFRDPTKMISGSSEIPKDLEEASSKFATHIASNGVSVEFLEEKLSFQEGAKWQKEQDDKELSEKIVAAYQLGLADKEKQMLNEAVEGFVNYYEDSGGILMAEAQVGCPYHNGDKVKIIIVKED